jgi:RNA polymerase sigma factor (sigma-70 family)
VKAVGVTVSDRQRFEHLYSETHISILRYLLRRVIVPADAADLLAETYLVAWRRIDVVPQDEGLLWLYGVARRIVANYQRHERVEHALGEALRSSLSRDLSVWQSDSDIPFSTEITNSLRALQPVEREIIELSAWEHLTSAEIGEVLGIKPGTVRVKLHRIRLAIGKDLIEAGHPGANVLKIAE